MMTAQQVRELLAERCRNAGSQRDWARANGVSESYVCDVLLGRREPGETIASALSLHRVMMYLPTEAKRLERASEGKR